MKSVLLTGVNGYVGSRLVYRLLDEGYQVYALARAKTPFIQHDQLHIIFGDLLQGPLPLPKCDVAIYLLHSMKDQKHFDEAESLCAKNFIQSLESNEPKQIIYLSGICNSSNPSKHLQSRLHVEEILKNSSIPCTILRAGIIIGSGSASFEIIRDLVEKLPIMIGPKWLKNRCTPISIKDVIEIFSKVLLNKAYLNQTYDIACRDEITFEHMLLVVAKKRGLKRVIIHLPFLTPYLSSLWLALVTSVNFALATQLVQSMRCDLIAQHRMEHEYLSFESAVERAFQKIEENAVISRWCDDWDPKRWVQFDSYVHVPKEGCFSKEIYTPITVSYAEVVKNIFSIGGNQGWYYANFLWKCRGLLDKIFGGVGLRRGRKNPNQLKPGEALDFWRVLVANQDQGRLLLYAEMKMPGEAWLEFSIQKEKESYQLRQTATFRPKGIAGRLYWYVLVPFHYFIFKGMAKKIAQGGI